MYLISKYKLVYSYRIRNWVVYSMVVIVVWSIFIFIIVVIVVFVIVVFVVQFLLFVAIFFFFFPLLLVIAWFSLLRCSRLAILALANLSKYAWWALYLDSSISSLVMVTTYVLFFSNSYLLLLNLGNNKNFIML